MTDLRQRLRLLSAGDVVLAVLATRKMIGETGMKRTAGSALETAVSELSSNVIKYARSGVVTLRPMRRRDQPGIEVVVEDRGPGIENVALAMTDHVSTGGTLGLGLPGTKRLVDEFELKSEPGKGTRIRIVKWG